MPRKPRQTHIPGTEPETVPEVHKAIEDYCDVRDERLGMQGQEKDAKATLVAALKKAGLTHYNVDGRQADLETDENVKAKVIEREPGGKE